MHAANSDAHGETLENDVISVEALQNVLTLPLVLRVSSYEELLYSTPRSLEFRTYGHNAILALLPYNNCHLCLYSSCTLCPCAILPLTVSVENNPVDDS